MPVGGTVATTAAAPQQLSCMTSCMAKSVQGRNILCWSPSLRLLERLQSARKKLCKSKLSVSFMGSMNHTWFGRHNIKICVRDLKDHMILWEDRVWIVRSICASSFFAGQVLLFLYFFMKLRRAKGRRHVDVPFYLFKKKSKSNQMRSLAR